MPETLRDLEAVDLTPLHASTPSGKQRRASHDDRRRQPRVQCGDGPPLSGFAWLRIASSGDGCCGSGLSRKEPMMTESTVCVSPRTSSVATRLARCSSPPVSRRRSRRRPDLAACAERAPCRRSDRRETSTSSASSATTAHCWSIHSGRYHGTRYRMGSSSPGTTAHLVRPRHPRRLSSVRPFDEMSALRTVDPRRCTTGTLIRQHALLGGGGGRSWGSPSIG